ncbi:MAG: hypothetical protein RIQ47_957 [Bacteroidota bacterium]|jgi:hypothetical protein
MKNEPVMTYDHINEERLSSSADNKLEKEETYPISLYMLLVVDAMLISGLIFMVVKIIF